MQDVANGHGGFWAKTADLRELLQVGINYRLHIAKSLQQLFSPCRADSRQSLQNVELKPAPFPGPTAMTNTIKRLLSLQLLARVYDQLRRLGRIHRAQHWQVENNSK